MCVCVCVCLCVRARVCDLCEREQHGKLDAAFVPLYLRMFRCIVEAVCELHRRGIIHFDLKCDNVLLRCGPGVTLAPDSDCAYSADILPDSPLSAVKPLIALADFGEATYHPGQVVFQPSRELAFRSLIVSDSAWLMPRGFFVLRWRFGR